MLAALALAVAAATPTGLDWVVLPVVNWDADDRLGLGATAQLQWRGIEPYRHQLVVRLVATTAGVQTYWARWDAPALGGTALKAWARAEYHDDRFQPWFGAGNRTPASPADVSGEHPVAYHHREPWVRAGVTYPLWRDLRAALFVTARATDVSLYDGSLLAAERPLGIDGGHELEGAIGLSIDRRDDIAIPRTGYAIDAIVRGAGAALGSTSTYAGVNVRALGFVPLGDRVVLGARLDGDWLSSGAPFYVLPLFGDVDAIEGIGGTTSARGIPKDRYVGHGKAIANIEVRALLADLGNDFHVGVVGFVDVGKVFEPGVDNGPAWLVHPGAGAGLRLSRRRLVWRLDVASSFDRALGVYMLFGHFF